METNVEKFRETAANLDQRFASEQAAKWLASALVINVCVGGIAATVLENSEHSSQNTVQAEALIHVADNIQKLPFLETHRSHSPKPVRERKVAEKALIRPNAIRIVHPHNYKQVFLPSRPSELSISSNSLPATAKKSQPFYDVSHPQCLKGNEDDKYKGVVTDSVSDNNIPVFDHKTDFAIIGVNGGRPFTSNRCLSGELKLPKQYDLYVNSEYPGYGEAIKLLMPGSGCASEDRVCVARNYGLQSGRYALQIVKKAGGYAPNEFWIDVESEKRWKGSIAERRAMLGGETDALLASNPNMRVGYYSVPTPPVGTGMWQRITGDWKNGADTWIATGINDPNQALAACSNRASFTGGPVLYSQYTNKFDQDVRCPSR